VCKHVSWAVGCFAAAALVSAPLLAQYDSVAVSGDGSRVLVGTRMALRGDSRTALPRVYELTPSGLQLVAEPSAARPAEAAARSPRISDDGAVIAWAVDVSRVNSVRPMFGIIGPYVSEGVIQRRSDGRSWRYSIPPNSEPSLSRSGRWFSLYDRVLDLQSAGEPASHPSVGDLRSDLSDDGSYLTTAGDASVLQRLDGSATPLPAAQPFLALLDRGASQAWYFGYEEESQRSTGTMSLLRLALPGGEVTAAVGNCRYCTLEGISSDGARVLFSGMGYGLDAPKSGPILLWLYDSASQTVLPLGEAVAGAAISGDGSQVVFNSVQGELVSLQIDAGVRTVLLPVSATLRPVEDPAAPGSRSILHGTGLRDAVLRINGVEIRPLVNEDTYLEFVVPMEAGPDAARVEVEQPGSPLAPATASLPMVASQPRVILLWQLGVPGPTALWPYVENGTRGGLTSPEAPLRPGEEVWIHMNGLGRRPEDGQWFLDSWDQPLASVTTEYDLDNPGWQVVKLRLPAELEARGHLLILKTADGAVTSTSVTVEAP
jgi:hypothetical protein